MTYIDRRRVDTYTADGAISPTASIVNLAGAAAIDMVLPDPNTYLDGFQVTVIATTAQAHTVTNGTGFNGAGAAGDVATFGGAVGDSLQLVAIGGVWYVTDNTNVTIA